MKVIILKKKVLAIIVAVLILVPSLIFTSGAIVDVFSVKRSIPIYSVEREDKVVAISFDCAWGTDYTDGLLKLMEEENVKSTFFAVGFWINKYPEYVKKIVDMGHDMGTHSATHPYMSKLDKQTIIKELSTSTQDIEKITGKQVDLFRAPYGDYNNLVVDTAKEMGLYTIQWDVDSLDWTNNSKEDIQQRVLKKVKNGSIVLFHNQGQNTLDALPYIIKSLKEKGYTFLKVSELIYRDNYHIDGTGRQIKNS